MPLTVPKLGFSMDEPKADLGFREVAPSFTSSIQISWKAGGETHPVSASPAALGLIQDCHSRPVLETAGCSAPSHSLKLCQLFHIHPPLLSLCPATALAFF